MAQATSVAFADSYLSGATLINDVLTTKTNIAFDRIMWNWDAMELLQETKIKLTCPNGRIGKPYQRKQMTPAERIEARQMVAALDKILKPRDIYKDRWLERMRRPA